MQPKGLAGSSFRDVSRRLRTCGSRAAAWRAAWAVGGCVFPLALHSQGGGERRAGWMLYTQRVSHRWGT